MKSAAVGTRRCSPARTTGVAAAGGPTLARKSGWKAGRSWGLKSATPRCTDSGCDKSGVADGVTLLTTCPCRQSHKLVARKSSAPSLAAIPIQPPKCLACKRDALS